MAMPTSFPKSEADRIEYARAICDRHRQLTPTARKVCMERIKQENPCLVRLMQRPDTRGEGCGA